MKALQQLKWLEDVLITRRKEMGLNIDESIETAFAEVIAELGELQNRKCDNCKHYQPLHRNGELFKRCFFLGTVGDIKFCGR